jgi:transloator
MARPGAAAATAVDAATAAANQTRNTIVWAQRVSTVARVGEGAAEIGQGAAGIAGAAYTYEANEAKAEQAEIRTDIAKIQQFMDDEIEYLQAMIMNMQSFTGKVIETIEGQAEADMAVVQRFG